MSDLALSYPTKKISDVALVDPENLPESTPYHYRLKYIDLSAVSVGSISDNIDWVTFENAPSRARRVVKKGDVLMATVRPNLQGFAKLNDIASGTVASTGFAVIRASDDFDNEFLYQNLFSDSVTAQIEALVVGSNYPAINSSEVRNLLIPAPDLRSQQKIAKILSTVDNLIEKTQSLIDKYTAIKQGMMADLFTRGIDMTTSDTQNSKGGKLRPSAEDAPELYKQTELGWVPKEWEVLSFGELADYNNGNSFSADSWKEEGYSIIRIQNLNGSNEYNYYEGPVKSIWHVLPGDLLFAWSGQKGVSFGARIWNGPEGVLNQHIFKVYENSKLLTRQFLYYLFKLNVGRIEDNAHGFKDSFVHVTRSELTDVTVMVPPKEEQAVIEQRVIALDRKLEQELGSLEKYKKLKKGLMQDLLTGKVTVA